MTARVGIVTYDAYGELTADDRLLLTPMRALGMDPRPVVWDAPGDWTAFDALIVRSPWNYFEHPGAFAAWIDARERDGSRLWNPPSVLRWNMSKDYLRELAAAGIAVVETEWLARGSAASVEETLARRGWDRAVVKPTISAGAWKTHRVRRGEPPAADFATPANDHDLMVQPFLDQVVDEGEWSFIFLGGAFAGAVLKQPARGDFRVQERHGGSTRAVPDPPHGLVDQAAATLAHAPGDLLYARVDGIRDDDRFVVIELEVLEPVLFFGMLPGSADQYAAALATRIR